MNNTQRDEKDDRLRDPEPDDREREESSGGSADKLPAMPASDDDSPLGDTDQHSTA